jgi:hypothetical protein
MLRVLFASALALLAAAPALPDDMATCRDKDKQLDPTARLDACDRIIAAGQASGKDLAAALFGRGRGIASPR